MKILLLNQCFYPDVVSASQHLTDFAVGLAERGHQVTVIASRRGYDDPSVRFSKRERWKGINIIRLPSIGLGKETKSRRALSFASFLIACVFRLIILPKHDVVVGMTAPPLVSFIASLFVKFKGGRFLYWVLDLNPDEAIAAGWLRQDSVAAKFLSAVLLFTLRHAEKIIVLDRFMKDRILAKGVAAEKIEIIPPWSHDDAVKFDAQGRNDFRALHDLSDKFVVMYSGNHSPCHPLDTLLNSADKLKDRVEIAFCFVGGGSQFARVKSFAAERRLKNISCLPYQPLDRLSASLSAADLHVVVMGDPFTGMVHPCKIYNVLSIGSPFLYIGPEESHVIDIVSQLGDSESAHVAKHDEIDQVVSAILAAARNARNLERADEILFAKRFSMGALLPRMVESLESHSSLSPVCGSTVTSPGA
ncbi:MAG TPA: glycosyltransferase family 4 protein [Pyrinomonadaceae bacterium]|nr:glycosyltransferase family 4 protein [Pyrinomonadaceae bacterium]